MGWGAGIHSIDGVRRGDDQSRIDVRCDDVGRGTVMTWANSLNRRRVCWGDEREETMERRTR